MEQRAGAARRGGISLDALVLVLVTGLTLHQDSFIRTPLTTPTLNAIAVGLVGLYLALDVLGQPLLAHGTGARRLFYGGKGAVLAAIVGLVLIWPTCHLIALRHVNGPATYVHDTSINVEEATKFLLAGKDPYSQTYFHTPLAQFGWHSEPKYGYGPNPALWWTDTFPGQELVTVPFLLASRATLGWFDERFIYLLCFGIAVLLLLRLAPTPPRRLALVAAVALNPWWVPTFIYGQNDILVLAEILAVLVFSLRGRWRLALLALAIGCATKQTTLLLVPFYLWWLALRLGPSWPLRLERLALLLPWLVAPFVLMVGPFAAWDWRGFYNGNFAYVAGTVPHSYPIQGYDAVGAASFVLWSGRVVGPNAYFPFWALELGAALPLAALLLRRMRPSTPATVMLGAYATVLFPIFYFSRFFHQSYAAYTIALFLVACLAHRRAPHRAEDGHLSFDVLVPLLLVPQVLNPPSNRANGISASVAFGLLLAYVVVAALTPWGQLRAGYVRRHAAAARALVLAGLAEVAIFSRALGTITDRLHWLAPAAFIHDTALQVELSTGALLKWHNPYTISFLETPLSRLYTPPSQHVVLRPDLPLTHNPHLPLGFLLSAPAQFLFSRLHLLFDERYLYLLALLAVAALLPLLVQAPARQLALLAAVLFSPLFATAVINGQDDVLVLLALVVGLLLLQREHHLAASFALGLALALKLTAWPLAPLWLAYLAGLDRALALSWAQRLVRVLRRSWGLVPPLAASTLPFILWSWRPFVKDVIAYPLGLMHNAVPLDLPWGAGFQTLGFGRVALGFGWAQRNGEGYFGSWLALGLGALVLGVLLVRLWRAPELPLLMAGYLVLLFTLEYFGRFMISTALGYLAVLAPLAFFLPPRRPAARAAQVPLPASVGGEAAVAV
jgi:Glycosyltransferase family 87